MILRVLGSSSKGNCYLLQNSTDTLILEAGVSVHEIKRGLSFKLSNVAGCLVTHEHGDHSKAVFDLMNIGVKVYTSRGTARALKMQIDHHRLQIIQAGEIFEVGSFKVLPFKIEHDVAEPLGFIINHPESGSILFITDSYFVRDTFKNISHVLIEANFSQEIIDQRVRDGASPEFLRNRVFKSHMSIETCLKTLKANDLSKVRNIVLIHLSDGNSDAKDFEKRVADQTGKPVFVADAGMVLELKKHPF